MSQLITRLDDDLHQRLRQRAQAEGMSVNRLVVGVLEQAMADVDEPGSPGEVVRARAQGLGLVAIRSRGIPSAERRAEVIAASRGAGQVVSQALEDDRGGQ